MKCKPCPAIGIIVSGITKTVSVKENENSECQMYQGPRSCSNCTLSDNFEEVVNSFTLSVNPLIICNNTFLTLILTIIRITDLKP
jgi:hypothetical protein